MNTGSAASPSLVYDNVGDDGEIARPPTLCLSDESNDECEYRTDLKSPRACAVDELLQTESSNLRNIQALANGYRAAASRRAFLFPDEDLATIFGNAQLLLEVTATQRRRLVDAARVRPGMPREIGAIFDEEWSRSMSVYGDFVCGVIPAIKRLDAMLAPSHPRHQELAEFLSERRAELDPTGQESAKDRSHPARFDLRDLLKVPGQRLMRYPLLLSEILGQTPPDHPDRPLLCNAIGVARGLCARVDTAKEAADYVDQLSTLLFNYSGSALRELGDLLKEGPVGFVAGATSALRTAGWFRSARPGSCRVVRATAFLFERGLVVATERRRNFLGKRASRCELDHLVTVKLNAKVTASRCSGPMVSGTRKQREDFPIGICLSTAAEFALCGADDDVRLPQWMLNPTFWTPQTRAGEVPWLDAVQRCTGDTSAAKAAQAAAASVDAAVRADFDRLRRAGGAPPPYLRYKTQVADRHGDEALLRAKVWLRQKLEEWAQCVGQIPATGQVDGSTDPGAGPAEIGVRPGRLLSRGSAERELKELAASGAATLLVRASPNHSDEVLSHIPNGRCDILHQRFQRSRSGFRLCGKHGEAGTRTFDTLEAMAAHSAERNPLSALLG